MIFADVEYETQYWELHAELVAFVTSHFSQVQSGLQGDSWIWIEDGGEKVAIDTFTSMKHQIIEVLKLHYVVNVYGTPELEAHEDD